MKQWVMSLALVLEIGANSVHTKKFAKPINPWRIIKMVNEKKKEQPLLSFQDKDGNPREIFERDLTDATAPLVEEISRDLQAEQQLSEAYQLATKTVHHMEAVRKNVANTLEKLEKELPPYKKPIKIEGVTKEIN
jgi:hypothetical protein